MNDKFCFMSLGSSSSGNCYYVGTREYGFLVDAGINVKTIKRTLRENGIEMDRIFGVFITHAHTDHVRYVGVLAEKYNIPIYSTQLVSDGIAHNHQTSPRISSQNRRIFQRGQSVRVKDFTFTSFPVSHDINDAMGYSITYQDKRLVIATDLGYISKEVSDHIVRANYLVIESNYDEEMLKNGPYPYHLKQRVKSHTGHLSNDHTAKFLADNWHDDLTHLFLCHISGENNTPELAYETVKDALDQKQIQPTRFEVLDRLMPSEMFVFE